MTDRKGRRLHGAEKAVRDILRATLRSDERAVLDLGLVRHSSSGCDESKFLHFASS